MKALAILSVIAIAVIGTGLIIIADDDQSEPVTPGITNGFLSVSIDGDGSVSYSAIQTDSVTLTAVDGTVGVFVGWYSGETLLSSTRDYSVTIDGETVITAVFGNPVALSRLVNWAYPQSDWNAADWTSESMAARVSTEDYLESVGSPIPRDFVPMKLMFIDTESESIRYIAEQIDELTEGCSDYTKAVCAMCFVQAGIQYELDSVSHTAEYWKFPIETLYDGRGDCEDTAILLASIWKCMGLDSALIILTVTDPSDGSVSGHAVAGICLDGLDGTHFTADNGREYYYAETAIDGSYEKLGHASFEIQTWSVHVVQEVLT